MVLAIAIPLLLIPDTEPKCTKEFDMKTNFTCCEGLKETPFKTYTYCLHPDTTIECDEICTEEEGYYAKHNNEKKLLDLDGCRPKLPATSGGFNGNAFKYFYAFAYQEPGNDNIEFYDNICCRSDPSDLSHFLSATKLKETVSWREAPQTIYKNYDDGSDIVGWVIELSPFNHGYNMWFKQTCYDFDTNELLFTKKYSLSAGSYTQGFTPFVAGSVGKGRIEDYAYNEIEIDKPRRIRCDVKAEGTPIVYGEVSLYYEICDRYRNWS